MPDRPAHHDLRPYLLLAAGAWLLHAACEALGMVGHAVDAGRAAWFWIVGR